MSLWRQSGIMTEEVLSIPVYVFCGFVMSLRVVEVAKRREGLHPERDRSRNKTAAPYERAEGFV